MRKTINIIALFALFATVVYSCSKDNSTIREKEQVGQTIRINFNAQADDPSTKTYFGEKSGTSYPTIWTADQQVKIIFNTDEHYSAIASVTPSSNEKVATFSADFSGIGPDLQLWLKALSPASCYYGNCGGWGLGFKIPSTQTPTINSVDEAAHILYSEINDPFDSNNLPETVDLHFSHVAAYGKFMLKSFPENVTIKKIELSADKYLTGESIYPPSTEYTTFKKEKTLTILPSEIEAENNASMVFWFSVLPVNLESETLTFKITTSGGVFTKAITFPSGTGNFQKGKVAAFGVNMAGVEPEPLKYKLVTDYSELTEGSEVMIIASHVDKAMSVNKTTNETYRMLADITKNSNYIQNPGDDVQIFTLAKGTADNTVKFECKNGGFAGKYIGGLITTSPSDHNKANQWKYIYNMDAADANTTISFEINLQDNADALISQYNSENRYKYIAYWPDGPSFRIDDSYLTNYAVSIYKLEGSGEGGEQLIIHKPEFHFLSGVNMPAESGGMYYVGNTMNLPASGGTYTVTYEIKYPAEEGEIQPQSGAVSWMSLSSPIWSPNSTSNSVSGNTATLVIDLPENT